MALGARIVSFRTLWMVLVSKKSRISLSPTAEPAREAGQIAKKDNAEYVPVCTPGQTEAAVHPFRTPEAWFKCLGTITGKSYSS